MTCSNVHYTCELMNGNICVQEALPWVPCEPDQQPLHRPSTSLQCQRAIVGLQEIQSGRHTQGRRGWLHLLQQTTWGVLVCKGTYVTDKSPLLIFWLNSVSSQTVLSHSVNMRIWFSRRVFSPKSLAFTNLLSISSPQSIDECWLASDFFLSSVNNQAVVFADQICSTCIFGSRSDSNLNQVLPVPALI